MSSPIIYKEKQYTNISNLHSTNNWGGTCAERSLHEIFFRAMTFLTKNAPKCSPKCLSLYLVGPKESRRIPAKFPCKKSRQIHRRASCRCAGRTNNCVRKNVCNGFRVNGRHFGARLQTFRKDCRSGESEWQPLNGSRRMVRKSAKMDGQNQSETDSMSANFPQKPLR